MDRPTAAFVRSLTEDLVSASGRDADECRREVEILLARAVGLDARADLYTRAEPLVGASRERASEWVARRATGEPVAYILGRAEFRGLEFVVDRRVLIPRPETELVVDEALRRMPDAEFTFIDIGTGSGAIAVSLATARPRATGVAIDISADALDVARTNAERNTVSDRLRFVCSDLAWDGLRADLVVSNPPYIADGEQLPPDVANFEPETALFAGGDGLDVLTDIIVSSVRWLVPGGLLVVEVGAGQAATVADLMKRDFAQVRMASDVSGIERVVSGARR